MELLLIVDCGQNTVWNILRTWTKLHKKMTTHNEGEDFASQDKMVSKITI